MSNNIDDTNPARSRAETLPPREAVAPLPPQAAAPNDYAYYVEDEDENSGPGCLAWGLMGMFSVLMAGAIVLVAVIAGFNDGIEEGRSNATATREADVATQCSIIPDDIAAQRFSLVDRRFEDLARDGALPACALALAPQATQAFLDSQATATPTSTPTPAEPTATPTLEQPQLATPVDADTASVPTESGNDSPFDLNGLLVEAQTFISNNDYLEAIDTLDAINAIDPTFQPGTINQLLFNALTQAAQIEFRVAGGSLQQGIILAERARQYGDIGNLGGEVTAATYYMNAQPHLGINYSDAIRWLTQLIALYPNYRDARTLLIDQYIGLGDLYAISGENCQAVQQYEAALAFAQPPDLVTKRDQAVASCQGLAPVGAAEVTADPNAAPVAATSTPAIAPIGQPGT